jgi:ubiquinone/menaquinone biosynthesis C-methylase UbiE
MQVTLQVANALKQPFEDGTFDLVWSMESGEHMPDKQQVGPSLPAERHQNLQVA